MKEKILLICVVLGCLGISPAPAETTCSFEGSIDFARSELSAEIYPSDGGKISIRLTAPDKPRMDIVVSIKDFNARFFRLSTELRGEIEQASVQAATPVLRGKIVSQYTLIDRKPIRELSSAFEISNRKISLSYFTMGGISGSGRIDLAAPYAVDLRFQLNEIALLDFIDFWSERYQELSVEGFVSGQIHLSGALDRPAVRGILASYGGAVNTLEYDSIVLNLEGIYPIIHLVNSTVTKTSGLTSQITGSIDLSDTKHFSQQMLNLKKVPLVSERESAIEWTIKRRESEAGSGSTELKYLLRKETRDPTQTDSGMLGVEHSLKF